MIVKPLELVGAFYIEPKIFHDNRGFFFEWFNKENFKQLTGFEFNVVQFNYSRSTKGVLRGLHYQLNPMAQSKLIGVTKGSVQDVIVDVRKNSLTYGQHYSVILSEEKRNQLFIPKGFAHGFLVLSEVAEIFYAIDNGYSPGHDNGISYCDPNLGIVWEIDKNEIVVSDKDQKLLNLELTPNNFE
ncbi:dTDP-4-dehydrorhamnose 3,5-epimerase [Reichenbachiella sp. MALMAid0571]|uniref:dTDP-4-dehydrorhamnose 3,5-epimerase n=1 Tax=Reichenbachiella sp. MALMAid0571 TaxID=3143939 RepID=UPI0032DE8865